MPKSSLKALLSQPLPAVVVIESGEPLLGIEALDQLRAHAKNSGFSERKTLHASGNFNWSQLIELRDEMSLFADQELVEVQLLKYKLDKKAEKALGFYLERPADGKVLVITLPAPVWPEKPQAIHRSFEQHASYVSLPSISLEGFPSWLKQRLTDAGLTLAPDAFDALVTSCEGNPLAAQQDVNKLKLFNTGETVSLSEVTEMLSPNARYTVNDLRNACSNRQPDRVLRIIESLEAEGESEALILRVLGNLANRQLGSQNNSHAIAVRQQLMRARGALLGQTKTPAWLSITQLALRIAGHRGPAS